MSFLYSSCESARAAAQCWLKRDLQWTDRSARGLKKSARSVEGHDEPRRGRQHIWGKGQEERTSGKEKSASVGAENSY